MPLLEPSEVTNHTEPSTNDLVEVLNHVLLRTTRAVIFRMEDHSPLDELPLSQIRCLNAVGNDEGRKMQEIAQILDVKLPAMSQMVERLVKKGLLERRADPSDRRVARLHLTETARQMIHQARLLRLEHLREATEALDSTLLQRLIADLRLLAESGERVHATKGREDVLLSDPTATMDSLVNMSTPRPHPPAAGTKRR